MSIKHIRAGMSAYWLVILFLAATLPASSQNQANEKWYKGNTHTHTVHSDGDSTPADVVRWYKGHRYHFLVLSDHNYLTAVDGLNSTFGASEKFLLIPGEEVTDRFGQKPIHVNGLNIREVVPPQHGTSVVTRLVAAPRSRGGGSPSKKRRAYRWPSVVFTVNVPLKPNS